MVTKLESGASRIMSAEGMITGGGVAMCTGDEGIMVVTRGEDILSLSASAARTALRYAPRSPTDSYSSRKELMVRVMIWLGVGRGKVDGFFLLVLARLLCAFGRSFFVGVSAIEVGDKFWGVFQMLHGFPGTVTRGET